MKKRPKLVRIDRAVCLSIAMFLLGLGTGIYWFYDQPIGMIITSSTFVPLVIANIIPRYDVNKLIDPDDTKS